MKEMMGKRRKMHENTPMETIKEKEEEGEAEVGEDRISNLPDHIVHHILSFLPTKIKARMMILSKRWEYFWATFPFFDFEQDDFQDKHGFTYRRKFFHFMRTSLSRRNLTHMQRLRISAELLIRNDHLGLENLVNNLTPMQRLRVCKHLVPTTHLENLFNRYIVLAMTGKVQILELNLKSSFCRSLQISTLNELCDRCYVLPEIVFSSASSLVSLMLQGCHIQDYDVVNFVSLKTISIKNVHITDYMVQKMISGCPLVESLTLECCYGLRTLRVFSLKLKFLVVNSCKELEGFEMDVPNVQSFTNNGANSYTNLEILEFKASSANSFSSLNTLFLSYVTIKEQTFRRMISSFPNLETLNVKNCILEKRPRVFCEKLKTLEVDNCDFPELVEVNAPNLQSLICIGINKSCRFRLSDRIGFGSLKALSLVGFVEVTDVTLLAMISSCPLLEILSLKFCKTLKHIKIFSHSLKSLVVDNCYSMEYGEIEAPNLIFFLYVGPPAVEFSRITTSYQLDAQLHLPNPIFMLGDDFQPIKLRNLIRKFDHARVLTLVSKCAEGVIVPKEISVFPPLYYLRHLKVKTSLREMDYIDLLSGVLRISYCRKTLSIDLGSSTIKLKFQGFPQTEEIDCLGSEWTTHDCVRDHLVEVKLVIFEGGVKEMKLVEFLLSKAALLKTVLISITKKQSCEVYFYWSEIMMTRLQNYSKASPICEIIFT